MGNLFGIGRVSAKVRNVALAHLPDRTISAIAFITALAAGGILSMVAATMIPEAFEEAHSFIGLITAVGFLSFFLLMKMGI